MLVDLLQLDLDLLWLIILEALAGKWLELDQSSAGLVSSFSLLPYKTQHDQQAQEQQFFCRSVSHGS